MKRYFVVAVLSSILFFGISYTLTFADGNSFSVGSYPTIQTSVTKSAETSISPEETQNTSGVENDKHINSSSDGILSNMLASLFWAIVGGFIGSFIAILIDKYQKPKLDIIATEEANADNTYPRPHLHAGRWKFFRVLVLNKPVNKFLSPFIARETAQQVSATITVRELNQTMKGRWAGTLELVQANPADYIRIVNFPDPMNIYAGGTKEQLDIFTKSGTDDEAYGWNNEAYLYNWRNPRVKMQPGNYTIDVTVTALDGSQTKKTFRAHIATRIENTSLT